MIVPAEKQDAREVIALMFEAIGSEIARNLTGTDDDGEAIAALEELYREEGNRVSYQNCIVDKRDGKVAGMLLCYSGDEAAELDKPLLRRIREETGRENPHIQTEAEKGDYYLDSLAVGSGYRGQGIATELIAEFERRTGDKGYSRASLIVEPDNAGAYALYSRLGYRESGELRVAGKTFLRMTKEITSS
ncbi:GNAT family N-acetyltransferase [Paenibacillus thailandensis]|uniref:GNAT family N-acetyltransferase n=1 Tax=Paenibacillus thailandensis TaxID=393250 RepID=A0ABW5QXG1_9BACL